MEPHGQPLMLCEALAKKDPAKANKKARIVKAKVLPILASLNHPPF